MTITRQELFSEIDELAKECHRLACEAELGEERTELFEMYNVLRNLGRQAVAEVNLPEGELVYSTATDSYGEDGCMMLPVECIVHLLQKARIKVNT